jgi:hypothetical protein
LGRRSIWPEQRSKLICEGGSFLVHAAVGDADGSVARHLQGGIPGSIALEGGAVAVEFPAVELGCEELSGPEGVDLVTEHSCVKGRHWQAVLAAERCEVVLQ